MTGATTGTAFRDLEEADRRKRMEDTIRTYFEGCNEADTAKMAATFHPDAVHYFPPGLEGPWRGAETIAAKWRHLVLTIGSAWTIDRMVTDPVSLQAVIEWTHYKTKPGGFLRGDEWYAFDPTTGLITEIRAYYASRSDPERPEVELEGFDYAARGYHLACPVGRPHPDASYEA
jgi:hypothetical protein